MVSNPSTFIITVKLLIHFILNLQAEVVLSTGDHVLQHYSHCRYGSCRIDYWPYAHFIFICASLTVIFAQITDHDLMMLQAITTPMTSH
jgi:hypothetical protein